MTHMLSYWNIDYKVGNDVKRCGVKWYTVDVSVKDGLRFYRKNGELITQFDYKDVVAISHRPWKLTGEHD